MSFVFKEDRRTNPDVYDDHVATGHAAGVITINAAEADDVYREEMRVTMNEPVRTLLGHFRHEAGHYYFDELVGEHNREQAVRLFGDPSLPYDAAVEAYYSRGPAMNWPDRFITAYASSHPAEDWAETWAHYLHIRAVLDAAESNGLSEPASLDDWRARFIDLIVRVNEIMRSLGIPDAYPFVITDPIAAKINFVHEAVMNRVAAG